MIKILSKFLNLIITIFKILTKTYFNCYELTVTIYK